MINLKNITLAYIFFVCISYNLKWFYLVGSFGYVDLLLPILFFATLKKKHVSLDIVSFLLIGLAIVACASSLYAVLSSLYDNFNIGYTLRSLYFVALYVVLLNSDVSTEDVVKTIALSLLFSLILCFYIWSTNPRYFGFAEIMPMLHVRESPSGLVVNRNESGLAASLLFTISLFGLVYRKLFSNPVNWFLVTLSFLTVAFSFSKGAWLLALIASFIIIIYRFKVTKFIIASAFLLVLVPFLPLAELAFVDAVITRFTGSDMTNAIRLSYVLDSAFIGANNFFLGIGPGNYQEYTMANDYVVTIDPHNTYMQSFAELGIFGLILVLFFYGINLLQSFFNAKKDKNHIIIFVLIILLAADGMQSGLSLSMKILYILSALTMRRVLNVRDQT
tara:strand:- start:747 stop:1916 length:1170 start_codon:yes stop_codon:yes gene_type:complete